MQNINSILSSCADPLFWVNLRHPLGTCEWMKCWWQGLGLGPQHQNLQGKALNHKTARAQLKGNDGPEKGKLGGERMQRMGLRGKPYSKETHQSATSSRNKEIKKTLWGLFGTILEITLPTDEQGANQKMGQGNSMTYFVLSSLSLLKVYSPFPPLSFTLFFIQFCGFSTGRNFHPSQVYKFCQWVTQDGAVKILLLVPPNSTRH